MVGGGGALGGVEDSALVELELGGIQGNREGSNLNEGSGNIVRVGGRGVGPVGDGVSEFDIVRLALAEHGVSLSEGRLRFAIERDSSVIVSVVSAHLHGVTVGHAREAVAVLSVSNSSAVGHVLVGENSPTLDDALEGKVRPSAENATVTRVVILGGGEVWGGGEIRVGMGSW